jgi:hypothetical protein
LVRPDGHVAWRADALPNDCLALVDTVRGSGLNVAARRHDAQTGRSSHGGVKSVQQLSRREQIGHAAII